MDRYDQMAVGAIAMGYAVAGLFFLRFWRNTRDRLFLLFSVALFVLAANRVVYGLLMIEERPGGQQYWVRLAAFALILLAILDKNRARPPKR